MVGRCNWSSPIHALEFLGYAQDWDGDGKKDLWGNEKDVFASIAFYLKSADWKNDITWGRQVLLPEDKNFLQLAKNKKIFYSS